MRKIKITIEEVREIVKKKMDIDRLGTRALRLIANEIVPFSFHCYCNEKGLNPNFLMDKNEKQLRRKKEKC